MKLATFEVDDATGPVWRLGVVDGDDLLDVTAGHACLLAREGEPRPMAVAEALTPPDMLEFLRAGEDAMNAARRVLNADIGDERAPNGARVRYPEESVSLRSPLPRPNTIRDFSVFEGHGSDNPEEWYEIPAYYKGNPDSVVPPGADVEWPAYEERLDFELEVAAVVGREGRDVAAEDAGSYIAGYTIFDDFSARDIQAREMEMGLGPGKGKDFANGFGPYLVTSDVFDPTDATMRVSVDGERWAEGNLGEMYHSFGDLVEHASMGETIHPGDVLGSGTVAGGCGYDLDRWIEPGATIELEVEGIGTLRHRVVRD